MVDYSKWDNFCDSDDEDHAPSGPLIHTIEKGNSIQIGPSGASIVASPETGSITETTVDVPRSSPQPQLKQDIDREVFSAPTHRWSQDRYEVLMWIDIGADVKASDICIWVHERSFELRVKDMAVLQKELRYIVTVPEDGIDWEIVTPPDSISRQLRVTMQKHVYVEGSAVWWSSVFVGDPEIDVSTLKGRKANTLSEVWKEANTLFQQRVASREHIEIDA